MNVLPSSPGQYQLRDQAEIRRILTEGIDGLAARLLTLEAAPPIVDPPPAGNPIPFGMFDLWTSSTARRAGSSQFNIAFEGVSPSTVIEQLDSAKAIGTKLIITMAGGGHANYLTNSAGGTCSNNGYIDTPTCVFDRSKWNAKIQTFNTAPIKAAFAARIADGTLMYSSTIDEPNHRSWGPAGTLTKPIIDDMAQYIKNIFPGIPVLCPIRPDWRLTDPKYAVLDCVQAQYVNSFGSITTWRNAAWSNLVADKVQINFSHNFGNGGAGFGETVCPPVGQPAPQSGSTGASSGRCEMGYGSVSSQVEVYSSSVLSPDPVSGRLPVGLLGWDQPPHIDTWLGRALVQQSMARIRAIADTKTQPSLYRLP